MIAVKIISESEIAKVIKDWQYNFVVDNPVEFGKMLYDLGMNIDKPVEQQDGFMHRNSFGEVVICTRWVGLERTDKDWLASGYASREARLTASGSKLVADLDRHKYVEY